MAFDTALRCSAGADAGESSLRLSQAASMVGWRVCKDAGRAKPQVYRTGATRRALELNRVSRPRPRRRLHGAKKMREAAAHRQRFAATLDAYQRLVAVVAFDARDSAQVDDGGAMPLPELHGIELLAEILDRLA